MARPILALYPGTDGPEPSAATCGNGRLDPGETCDPATDCPRSCPEVTCTVQRLVGTPETCDVRCEEEKITACNSGDKCCPRAAGSRCSAINDAECAAVCDNGAVEAGETCDPKSECQAKADACKDDRDTLRTVNGEINACTTSCSERKRPCQTGDGQCPTTCTSTTDADCTGCGNGRVETGETCDPPTECQRTADSCRDDAQTLRTGSGDVNRCTYACTERRRPCQSGDSECPSGCAPGADTDCPGCGNRRVEQGETCDPCSNTSCNSDRNTIRTSTGTASSCTFRCTETARPCGPSDRECPSSCPAGDDPDCRKPNGQTCNGNSECVNGNCVDGICCNSRCDDGCRSCRVTGRLGTCSPPSGDEVCGNGPNGGNGRDDNCNGQIDENCCGRDGQACCDGIAVGPDGCESGRFRCSTQRRCQRCGAVGQPCCANSDTIFCTGTNAVCANESTQICEQCGLQENDAAPTSAAEEATSPATNWVSARRAGTTTNSAANQVTAAPRTWSATVDSVP
jgi:hypothetical protein